MPSLHSLHTICMYIHTHIHMPICIYTPLLISMSKKKNNLRNKRKNFHKNKMSYIAVETLLVIILLFLPIVRPADVIPANRSRLNMWFDARVRAATAQRASLRSTVATAENKVKVIRVQKNGGGDFKTVTEAIKAVPEGNNQRVIVSIGPGNYTEKITIGGSKRFITLYGNPNDMPVLVYGGTAAKYGTVYSATLTVESDHFSAVNLKVVNSAPRPDGKRKGAQAVALRIGGDFASFYNCKFHGFQDTICDDKGRHFFKDCYIEGTVDFIFGSGTSLYLNSEIHVIPGDGMAIIAAQARKDPSDPTGFTFVHCSVTGTGGTAYLGRSWFPSPRVVYAYCDLSDVVNPQGWSNNFHPQTNRTVYFGEYSNGGPGANLGKRVRFAKKLSDEDVKPFISLGFIQASTWLLPPARV